MYASLLRFTRRNVSETHQGCTPADAHEVQGREQPKGRQVTPTTPRHNTSACGTATVVLFLCVFAELLLYCVTLQRKRRRQQDANRQRSTALPASRRKQPTVSLLTLPTVCSLELSLGFPVWKRGEQ